MKKIKIFTAALLTCLICFGQGQSVLAAGQNSSDAMFETLTQYILYMVTDDNFLFYVGLPAEEYQAISQMPRESFDEAAFNEIKAEALVRLDTSKEEAILKIENYLTSEGIPVNGNVIIDAIKGYSKVSDTVGIPVLLEEASAANDYFEIKNRSVKEEIVNDAKGTTVQYVVATSSADALVTAVYDAEGTLTSYSVVPGSSIPGGFGISDGMMKLIVLLVIVAILGIMALVSTSKKKVSVGSASYDEYEPTVGNAAIVASASSTSSTSNLELVAVIAAAIAASQGTASTDGIIIRSIRRR